MRTSTRTLGAGRSPRSTRWLRRTPALTVTLTGCAPPTMTSGDVIDAASDTAAFDAAMFDAAPLDTAPNDVPTRDVVGPLGLRPGVAATIVLGRLATPSAVDLHTAASDIDYGVDLDTRMYVVRLPAGFDPADTTRTYGLITYIDYADTHTMPASYEAALDAHDVIWVAGFGIGNTQNVPLRRGVALLGALRAMELFPVDRARVYAAGLSGGSRTASDLSLLRTDLFQGFLGRVGASFPAMIPGWQTAGTSADNFDDGYEQMFASTPAPSVLPVHFRIALMTQYGDFRRAENVAIYRYGHLNHGNAVRLVMRPGGHADEVGPSFTDALDYLEDPGVDLVWDRFEDGALDANVDPGRTVGGSGVIVRGGSVSEARYTYNGSTLGVLRLDGTGAAAELRDTFTWQNQTGITVDARLRAESAAGLNQQIGIHITPSGSSTAPAATQPGFHVYWAYGQPHHAELVTATGVRRSLATWTIAGPHPMDLPTTTMSPQAGEGIVPEKTFWNATVAPDAAGATLRFRGEDVRIVLSNVGFQLTFNRPASALVTPYAGQVALVPQGDGEELPIVLQGFWSEVESAAIAALPVGQWRLMVSNDAVDSTRPAGSALVDEIHIVGSVGVPAAPPVVRAVAVAGMPRAIISWTEVAGAVTYQVFRALGTGGAATRVGTVPGFASSFTDDSVTVGTTYAYQVAAVGHDGSVGARSPVATVTP